MTTLLSPETGSALTGRGSGGGGGFATTAHITCGTRSKRVPFRYQNTPRELLAAAGVVLEHGMAVRVNGAPTGLDTAIEPEIGKQVQVQIVEQCAAG